VDGRQRRAQVRVAFVGANHYSAGGGDGEVHPGEPRLRGEELLAHVAPGGLGELLGIRKTGRGAELLVEELPDLLLLEMDGGHDDVRGRLAPELHDPLSQVGVHHLDAVRFRCSLRWHSSVSMDLLFTSRVTPRSRSSPCTMRLCSAASRAQCTRAPAAAAFLSNSSR